MKDFENYQTDSRTVLTLDAGGTKFAFSAMRGGQESVPPLVLPSNGQDLERCLKGMLDGFESIISSLAEPPVAISFAFPGPADYGNGIIGDLNNLPAFRGGVALGSMLKNRFGLPVFINNDGDLFAMGESLSGALPRINGELKGAGSAKRYRNLIGVTLGTGFGGGMVIDGKLLRGDNYSGMEIWKMSNRIEPRLNAEELISVRALQRSYSRASATSSEDIPSPKEIHQIASGTLAGDRPAALQAFREMGKALGDVLCNLISIADGPVVIGGGLSGAYEHMIASILEEMRSSFANPSGNLLRSRLTQEVYNFEEEEQRKLFTRERSFMVRVPFSDEEVPYDPVQRIPVCITRLGTSRAISLGAYVYALSRLDDDLSDPSDNRAIF